MSAKWKSKTPQKGWELFKVRKSQKQPKLKSPVFKRPKGKGLGEMVKRLRLIEQQIAETKALYKERDQIVLALMTIPDKLDAHGLVLVDTFENTNTRFRNMAISRFEVQWMMKGHRS